MKLFKIFLILIAVVFVAAVIGVYALYHYSQSDKFKDDMIVMVEEETGRNLTIDGDLSLTIYPWAGVELNGVMMENAEGFSERPFLKADRIAIRIKTMPLLKKQYELDTFVLHGMELSLETNEQGKTNWQDLAGEAEEQSHEESSELPDLAAVILGGVDVQNGIVRWDDLSTETPTHYEVKDIQASTGPLTFGAPIDFNMTFKSKANHPAIEKDVKLSATLKYDLDNEIYSVEPLNIESVLKGKNIPGGRADTSLVAGMVFDASSETLTLKTLDLDALSSKVKANLVAADLKSRQPDVNGKVMVDVADMAELLKILEVQPLASNLAKQSDRKFNINAEIQSANDGLIEIPNLNVKGLGSNLNMKLAVKNLGSHQPSMKGNLDFSGKDLPLILQLAGAVQGQDSGLAQAGQEMSGIKNKAFKIQSEFDLDEDRIELPKLTMNLLATDVQAQLKSSGGQQASGNLSAKGKDLSLILQVLGGLQGKDSSLKTLANDLKKTKDRSFSVTADIDADMDKGKLEISSLLIKLLGADIQGNLNGDGINSDAPGYNGKLVAKGSDFPALLRLLGSFGKDSSTLGDLGEQFRRIDSKAFNIQTAFELEQGSGDIDLSQLNADLLGMQLNGKLKAKDMTSKNSSINGDMELKIAKPKGLLTAFGQGGLAEVVKSINLKAGVKGSASRMDLSPLNFRTTLSGKDIPNSPVDIALTAKTQANMEAQTIDINDFSLSGMGLDVKGNLAMKKFLTSPKFTGDLNIAPINLRSFMQSINQPLGATADPKVYGNLSLTSSINGSGSSVALKDLTIKLDDSTMKGELAVTDLQKGSLSFGIGIDQFNADRYVPAPESSSKGGEKKSASSQQKATTQSGKDKLPFDSLRDLNMQGDVLIGSLIYSNLKLKDVQMTVAAKDSKLKMKPVRAELYGGTYSGDLNLNVSGKTPRLTLNTNLKSVQLGPLEKDMMGTEQITGTADVNLALLSAGNTINGLKQSLTGKGKIAVADGVLQGIDVGKVLKEVEIMIEDKRIGKPSEGGETAFDSLTANLDINSGNVTNQDMLLKAPGFNVAGKGLLANLNNMTWNYDLLLSVDETSATSGEERYNIGGYSIPANCSGLIADKRCVPNVGSVLTTLFKKTLQDKLLEEIGLKKKKSSSSTESGGGQESSGSREAPSLEDVGKELFKGLFD